ncbi:Urease accessory protein UreE 1 [Pseudoruegeria aquimaris]|uniref:Urease accessory protein UreE n=1 Tax=Pseudoruegeria aquimaris TaxID=393663 RepID=A0A1Y5RU77_9RHOB|nr:urease accessory protein UreE [Pseudoruegeria aquimaris]SLN22759.1 Urease accessory protein UreE 1 [Pseudoruegeria aquimaris]
MSPLPVAQSHAHPPHATPPAARVALTYEGRLLRRRRLEADDGTAFLVDFPATASLDAGDAFVLEDGRLIEVLAAPEALLEVRGGNLTRLAWHIGNRHTPCEIAEDRLWIQADHVLAKMLETLGASVRPVERPFRPEGGAYGHGRTFGHAHGHGHEHGHEHAPDHAHG